MAADLVPFVLMIIVLAGYVACSVRRHRAGAARRSRLAARASARRWQRPAEVVGRPSYRMLGRFRRQWAARREQHGQCAIFRKDEYFPNRPRPRIGR